MGFYVCLILILWINSFVFPECYKNKSCYFGSDHFFRESSFSIDNGHIPIVVGFHYKSCLLTHHTFNSTLKYSFSFQIVFITVLVMQLLVLGAMNFCLWTIRRIWSRNGLIAQIPTTNKWLLLNAYYYMYVVCNTF